MDPRQGIRRGMVGAVLSVLVVLPLAGQEQERQWERRQEPTRPPITVFHATQTINLPTAETLSRGDWQFEISHRFFPPLSHGSDALWGLDGPVNMRLGLGYAPHDRALVSLGRSNLSDNLDLQLKVRVLESRLGLVPIMVALQGGGAWSDLSGPDSGQGEGFQAYGQVVLNALLGEQLALGLVPAFLHNVLPDSAEREDGVFWGLYAQWYASKGFSLVTEWSLGEAREGVEHDAGSFGVELETGGHFFKLFLTNSVRLNPSQFLAGTGFPFETDQWRLGFAITRRLRF